jgi:predicted nuclease of predicted toxin-antitoxin system
VGRDFSGIQDEDVIHLANHQKRVIITFDKDYGVLIFKNNLKPEKGVIFLRLKNYEPDEPGRFIEHLLKTDKFSTDDALTVFDGEIIRQRKY